jgi:hypothetical protein
MRTLLPKRVFHLLQEESANDPHFCKSSYPLFDQAVLTAEFCSTMDQKQIEITIGEGKDKKTFTMHKDLLHYHTSYFRGTLHSHV